MIKIKTYIKIMHGQFAVSEKVTFQDFTKYC